MRLSENLLLSRHATDRKAFLGAGGTVQTSAIASAAQRIIEVMDVRKSAPDPEAAARDAMKLSPAAERVVSEAYLEAARWSYHRISTGQLLPPCSWRISSTIERGRVPNGSRPSRANAATRATPGARSTSR